jgi:hypothetical protein
MTPDLIFTLANYTVLPGWLLLLLAPRARITRHLVHTALLSVAMAALYALYITIALTRSDGQGGFSSLQGVMHLFTVPEAALAGWLHYLAFDLFIGAWEARDAQRLGIPHLLLIPCLALTFLLGPIGLTLYLILRWTKRARFLDEAANQ